MMPGDLSRRVPVMHLVIPLMIRIRSQPRRSGALSVSFTSQQPPAQPNCVSLLPGLGDLKFSPGNIALRLSPRKPQSIGEPKSLPFFDAKGTRRCESPLTQVRGMHTICAVCLPKERKNW